MGGVNIELLTGQLGAAITTNDGVAGLMCSAATEGDVETSTPFLVTSYAAALGLGLTVEGNAFLLKQIREFYTTAPVGAKLYVMPLPADIDAPTACNKFNTYVNDLLEYSQDKVRVMGVIIDDAGWETENGDTVTVVDGINGTVLTAAQNLQQCINEAFDAIRPFRAIIGATSYTGVAADLPDLTTYAYSGVGILIGDTASATRSAAVGLALGRMAAIPVQRKISRVKDGALPINEAYIGSNLASAAAANRGVIADAGFITFTSYPELAGFFFSSDYTATPTNDDYHALARGRVIDKAMRLGYAILAQEVDNEVTVVAQKLEPGYTASVENAIVNQINLTMKAGNEISSVRCTIDPTQPILQTNNLYVDLYVVPVGYATEITLRLGLALS
ncbi:MAG: hypothetical protein EBZ77_06280 [Chitinophagia bacterium]|nr:hypothetical protein [Chitinophagia bacterium]